MSNPEQIYNAAKAAAVEAAKSVNADLGPEASRGFDCGFAWITIRPATTPFARWVKKTGHGEAGWSGGVVIWSMDGQPTQSVSVKEAACRAFRDVLAQHGISAEVGSRLD